MKYLLHHLFVLLPCHPFSLQPLFSRLPFTFYIDTGTAQNYIPSMVPTSIFVCITALYHDAYLDEYESILTVGKIESCKLELVLVIFFLSLSRRQDLRAVCAVYPLSIACLFCLLNWDIIVTPEAFVREKPQKNSFRPR